MALIHHDRVGPAGLSGRTIYALGDSIVAGHMYLDASFADVVARQEGATLVKRAVNGATVLPSDRHILTQLSDLPIAAPDYVLFDGGTNDAQPETLARLGAVSQSQDTFDVDTFAGSFENLIAQLQARYPEADLVYTAVHRMAGRDPAVQEALRELALAITEKWGVAVADVYTSGLDTTVDEMRVRYSFDSLQANGLPGTAETTGSWEVASTQFPTGIHPNLLAIEQFYVPVVSALLRRIAELRPLRAALAAKAAKAAEAAVQAGLESTLSSAPIELPYAIEDARRLAHASSATFVQLRAASTALKSAAGGLEQSDSGGRGRFAPDHMVQ